MFRFLATTSATLALCSLQACVGYPAVIINNTDGPVALTLIDQEGNQPSTELTPGKKLILRRDLSTVQEVVYTSGGVECRLSNAELTNRATTRNGTAEVLIAPCE